MNLIAYNTRHNSCILFGFYVRQNCKSNHKIENTEKWIMVKITRYKTHQYEHQQYESTSSSQRKTISHPRSILLKELYSR